MHTGNNEVQDLCDFNGISIKTPHIPETENQEKLNYVLNQTHKPNLYPNRNFQLSTSNQPDLKTQP